MMLPLAAYEVAVIDHTYFVHVHVLRCHSWCFDIRQVLSGIRDKHGHSLDEVITDLPTLPEFPGLSRKNDAYPLPRVLVQNSRARAEFVCAARCACNCA